MAVDASKELRRAVDTGKVIFGFKQAKKNVLRDQCQLVIASSNAERYAKEKVQQLCKSAEIPFYEFKATSLQLGGICGKPFVVSFACVQKPGKSKIMDAVQQRKTG